MLKTRRHIGREQLSTDIPPLVEGRSLIAVVPVTDDLWWSAEMAWNVARAAAGGDRRIALVDMFFDKPHLHELVGERSSHGITDAFEFGLALSHGAREQLSENIHFIAAGSSPNRTSNILERPRWKRLSAGFRKEDAVLFLYMSPGSLARFAASPDLVLFLSQEPYDPTTAPIPALEELLAEEVPYSNICNQAPATEDTDDVVVTAEPANVADDAPTAIPEEYNTEVDIDAEVTVKITTPFEVPKEFFSEPPTTNGTDTQVEVGHERSRPTVPNAGRAPRPTMPSRRPSPEESRRPTVPHRLPRATPSGRIRFSAITQADIKTYGRSRTRRVTLALIAIVGIAATFAVAFWREELLAVVTPRSTAEVSEQAQDVQPPPPPTAPEPLGFTSDQTVIVQVASFNTSRLANREASALAEAGVPVAVTPVYLERPAPGMWYRVFIGPFATPEDAVRVRDSLREQGVVSPDAGAAFPAPYSIELNAEDRDSVEAMGLATYEVDGRLLVGAFEIAADADATLELLTEHGITLHTLVERIAKK